MEAKQDLSSTSIEIGFPARDSFREDIIEQMVNEDNPETDLYFCLSDHLGSSSFITDLSGAAVEHLQYMPFGESFIDQRGTGHDIRFKFSGKEKDAETGYSYFGARYYDSELSVWLSVDPMSDERPWLSPYNYCQLNPVMLIDPDGTLDNGPGKRFKLHRRKMGSGQRLRAHNNKSNNPPAYAVNKIGRVFGLGRRIATVSAGRHAVTGWVNVGFGSEGKKCFDFDYSHAPIKASVNEYRLRGIRVGINDPLNPPRGLIWTLITVGHNLPKGRFGNLVGANIQSSPNGPGNPPTSNSFGSHLLPLLFPKSYLFAVYRGGSPNNNGYSLSIKYRYWKNIIPTTRNPIFKWWYGVK